MPPKKGRVQITVVLSEDQVALIDEAAESAGITRSEAVRRILAEHFGEVWPSAELHWGHIPDGTRAKRWAKDEESPE